MSHFGAATYVATRACRGRAMVALLATLVAWLATAPELSAAVDVSRSHLRRSRGRSAVREEPGELESGVQDDVLPSGDDDASAVASGPLADVLDPPIDAPTPAMVRKAAKKYLEGPRDDSWSRGLKKRFWDYGTCANSSRWGVPYFGARWPLQAGPARVYDELRVENETVLVPKQVYVVLNQQYMSTFKSRADAEECARPQTIIHASTIRAARPSSDAVLISQRGSSPTPYCVQLRLAAGAALTSKVFCVTNHNVRAEWVSNLQVIAQFNSPAPSADHADRAGSLEMHGAPSKLYPLAPRTICTGPAPMGVCLTSVFQVEEESKEDSGMPSASEKKDGEGTSKKDAAAIETTSSPTPGMPIELAPVHWLAGFPIRATNEQTWSVSAALDEASNAEAGTVNVCHRLKSRVIVDPTADGEVSMEGADAERTMCLTLKGEIDIPGQIPLPARRFIDCPGGNLRCFQVDSIRAGMRPTANDTSACEIACRQEPDGLCKGWVYTRPESTGTGFAKCCLKEKDVSGSCGANRCCDAHMNSETRRGMTRVETQNTPAVPNVLFLAPKVS